MPGDLVMSLNEQTGAFEYHPVNALLFMGTKPVFELVTASGKKIRTTGNHPYLVKGNIREEDRGALAEKRVELSEAREFEGAITLWRDTSGAVEPSNKKTRGNDKNSGDKDNGFPVHGLFPFAVFNGDNVNNDCEDSGDEIKVQQCHNVLLAMEASRLARNRNSAVITIPANDVGAWELPAAPGTKTPTTSDPNISFAPSRKKLESVSFASLLNIQPHSKLKLIKYQENISCSGAGVNGKWLKVIYLKEGDAN